MNQWDRLLKLLGSPLRRDETDQRKYQRCRQQIQRWKEEREALRQARLFDWLERAARETDCDPEQMAAWLVDHHSLPLKDAQRIIAALLPVSELRQWLEQLTLNHLSELLGLDPEAARSLYDAARDMAEAAPDESEPLSDLWDGVQR